MKPRGRPRVSRRICCQHRRPTGCGIACQRCEWQTPHSAPRYDTARRDRRHCPSAARPQADRHRPISGWH